MALLWSERGEPQARASLRQALMGLRRDLGKHSDALLTITDEAVTLCPGELSLAETSGGELLAGFHLTDPAFEEWLRDERLARDKPASDREGAATVAHSKPSIAVLPFANLSSDPEQDYFADGMTEDIITELSRFRELSVIARNSTFHYKGKSPTMETLGEELGVGYVVEGSVRKAGERVRITAQLIEVANKDHLWAERYDRDLEDIFAVQDEVTRNVVSTVAGRIDAFSNQRASRVEPESLQSYDLCLRAQAHAMRFNPADNKRARGLLERAIELDPLQSRAHARLCANHYMDWIGHWVPKSEGSLEASIRCGRRAVEIDGTDCHGHWNLAEAYLFAREFDKARLHFEKAIQVNPNDVEARTGYGFYLTCVREFDASLAAFEQARQVDPFDLDYLPWLEGFAFFVARRYQEAIACFDRIERPHYEVCSLLAASYAYQERLTEAKLMLETFLEKAEAEMVDFPGLSCAAWKENWRTLTCLQDEADIDHWMEGMRRAGLPD